MSGTNNNKSQWWANRSLLKLAKRHPTKVFGPRGSMSKLNSFPFEKHTFFPGNEIPRSRLSYIKDKYIFYPDSYIKAIWDIIILFLSIALCFTIPYSLSFNTDLGITGFMRLVNIVFVLDIAMQANSAYFIKGNLISLRTEILKCYASSWLTIDFLAAVPLELLLPNMEFSQLEDLDIEKVIVNIKNLWLLKLLKIFKYRVALHKIHYLFPSPKVYSLLTLLKHGTIASLPAHWAACILNLFFKFSLAEGIGIENHWDTNKVRYLRFLERAVQTMTSVGYGDVNIPTIEVRVFSMAFMICTSTLLGYFVGGFKHAILKSAEEEYFFRSILLDFKRFAEVNKLKKQLRVKIINYFKYLKFVSSTNILNEAEILSAVSVPLREQIGIYVRGFILIKIEPFSKFSKPCLKTLGERLNVEIYAPKDKIFGEKERSTSLYFVIAGKIDIVHPATSTTFAELTNGNQFGEIGFFLNAPRCASAISDHYSELFCLTQYDFLKTISTMPKDKGLVDIMLRNYKSYGLSALNIKCYLCKQTGHVSRSCPNTVFKVSTQKIMENYYKKINRRPTLNKHVIKKTEVKESNLTRFSVLNVKGQKIDIEKTYKNHNLAKLIKRADNWIIYKKKRSVYESNCSSSDEECKEELDVPRVIISRSRKERTSTIFVSNNFEV